MPVTKASPIKPVLRGGAPKIIGEGGRGKNEGETVAGLRGGA